MNTLSFITGVVFGAMGLMWVAQIVDTETDRLERRLKLAKLKEELKKYEP